MSETRLSSIVYAWVDPTPAEQQAILKALGRSSAGSLFRIPVALEADPHAVLAACRAAGVRSVATALDAAGDALISIENLLVGNGPNPITGSNAANPDFSPDGTL